MFCNQCAAENPTDAKFCYKCGAAITIPQQAPNLLIVEQVAGPQLEEKTHAPPLQQVRPWVRFWARFIDTSLLGCLISFLLIIITNSFLRDLITTQSQFYWAMGFIVLIALFLWIFVEPFLLSNFGTTPGKWLLKIQLTHTSGKPITVLQATRRLLSLWVSGLGLGIPLLSFIAQFVAYVKLKRNGVTSWDKAGGFTVSHSDIGILRIIVVIICVLVSLVLAITTVFTNALVRNDLDRFIDSKIEHTASPASSKDSSVAKKTNTNSNETQSSIQPKTSTNPLGGVEPNPKVSTTTPADNGRVSTNQDKEQVLTSNDWQSQAEELAKKEDWPGLINHALRWAKVQPECAEAWYNLGIAYWKSNQPDKEIEAYQQALRINPENASAWNNLGCAYRKSEQPDKAIEAYQQALHINPEFVGAWCNLGVAYRQSNQPDKEIEAYQQALRIDPEDSSTWLSLGVAYNKTKQYAKEIEAFQQAARTNPESSATLSLLGMAYDNAKQYAKAIEAFQQVIRINPEDADAWYNLGMAYNETKQYAKAIEADQQAVRINPEYARKRSYAQTKYGRLEIKSIGEDEEKRLLFGSKVLFKREYGSLSIKQVFHAGNREIVMICNSEIGSGTIDSYFFVNLMPNSPPILSEEFSCNNRKITNPIQEGDKITVDLGYKDGINEVLTYQNGKQSIEKIQAKDKSTAADEGDCEYLYNMYVAYTQQGQCDQPLELVGGMASSRAYDEISNDPHFDLKWLQDLSKTSCESGDWVKYYEFKGAVCNTL